LYREGANSIFFGAGVIRVKREVILQNPNPGFAQSIGAKLHVNFCLVAHNLSFSSETNRLIEPQYRISLNTSPGSEIAPPQAFYFP
jgi:hypothetical protein